MKQIQHHKELDLDMSPEAIERRLNDVNDLYQFGFLLKNAKYMGKIRSSRPSKAKLNRRTK